MNLYHNDLNRAGTLSPQAIAVRLVGGNRTAQPTSEASPRDAYGAIVGLALDGGVRLIREHRCGEGFAAQNSALMLIGVGGQSATAIEVTWPSGRQSRFEETVAPGSLVTVYEAPGDAPGGVAFVVEPYRRGEAVAARPQPSSEPVGGPTLNFSAAGQALAQAVPTAKLRVYTSMATWCSSCKQHLPRLARLREAFDAQTLALFGVPVDAADEPRDLEAYASHYRPAYRLLIGLSPSDTQAVQEALATAALPASVVTDQQGRILMTTGGIPSISDLRRLAESL